MEELIKSLSHRYWMGYRQKGVEYDDLVQEGRISYLKHRDKYDPDHPSGAQESTYLYWWVRGDIANYCKEFNKSINYKELRDIPTWDEIPLLDENELLTILDTVARPDVICHQFFGSPDPNVSRQVTSYHVCKMRKIVKEKYPELRERLV